MRFVVAVEITAVQKKIMPAIFEIVHSMFGNLAYMLPLLLRLIFRSYLIVSFLKRVFHNLWHKA